MKYKTLLATTILSGILGLSTLGSNTLFTNADAQSVTITGSNYLFDEKSNYEISDSKPDKKAEAFGSLTVTGDAILDTDKNFNVSKDNLVLSYEYDAKKLEVDDTEWHITKDSVKKVDNIKLDKAVSNGTIIVQTSLDGEKWTTVETVFDAFSGNKLNEFYKTSDVQQQNGCYYRVIVAYETEKTVGSHKVAVVDVEDKDYQKHAEVYEFHAENESSDDSTATTSDATPRKVLDTKVKKTPKDKGYSGDGDIDINDPHYGWSIGSFIINGYTREENNVFLKNVGDKVTLWFHLDQDIEQLHGDPNIVIAEDKNGYDKNYQVSKTNFKHGALIIQYTDHEGNKTDPIIYTDYLAANASQGADTKVQLFEEGDYTVKLDYEIENSPRQVAGVKVVPEYSDYTIEFEFSIRNGNCMVFPFDIVTGDELKDNAITENGFMLDMAKSRYLQIDVEHLALNENSEGILTTDTRFNRPAADGDTYENEGIYVFTVKNKYTNEEVTKTIYVGTDKNLMALSKNAFSVDELNNKLREGMIIEEDGTLSEPETEPETESESEVESESEITKNKNMFRKQ